MRKIKITALLLAALMVLTAFVGCAKTDPAVEALDDRVSALEDKINGQGSTLDKIDESIDSLAEALKKAQEAADAAAEAAKKAEEEAAKKAEEEAAADKAAAEQAAADAAKLAAAITEAAKKVELDAAAYAKVADLYTEATQAKILAAFVDARAALSSATIKTMADLEAVMAALEAVTSQKNAAVIVEEIFLSIKGKILTNAATATYYEGLTLANLRDVVKAITGAPVKNMTASSAAAVEKLLPGIDKDGETLIARDALKNFKMSDGTVMVDIYGDIVDDLYTMGTTTSTAATQYTIAYTLKGETKVTEEKLYSFRRVEYWKGMTNGVAKKAQAIAKATTFDAYIAAVNDAKAEYAAWEKAAMAVGGQSLVLTCADHALTISNAVARAEVVDYAYYMYARYVSFADYKALETVAEKEDFTKETLEIYDTVNTKIAEWAKTHGLTNSEIKMIVDAKEGAGFYANYSMDNACAVAWKAAYDSFVANYVARIKALNEIVAISQDNIDEKIALDKALVEWAKATATFDKNGDGDVADAGEKQVLNAAARADVLAKIIETGLEYTPEAQGYFKFVKDEVKDFFAAGGTYDQAKVAADAINAKIDAIDKTKAVATSTRELVALYGDYKEYSSKSAYYTVANGYPETEKVWANVTGGADGSILKFNNTYKKVSTSDSDFAYDLTGLVNVAKFNEVKAYIENRVTTLKAQAANVVSLFKAIADEDNNTAKTTGINWVNLDDLDAVNAAYAAFEEFAKNNGYKLIEEWTQDKDASGALRSGKYVYLSIVDEATFDTLYTYKTKIDKLVKLADATVEAFKLVDEINAYSAIKYNVDANAIVKKEVVKEGNPAVDVNYFSYVYFDEDEGLKVFDPLAEENEGVEAPEALTQKEAIAFACALYSVFLETNDVVYTGKDNGNKESYAPVETAKGTYKLADYVLTYNKSVVYELIAAVTVSSAEQATFQKSYLEVVIPAQTNVLGLVETLKGFDAEIGTNLAGEIDTETVVDIEILVAAEIVA